MPPTTVSVHLGSPSICLTSSRAYNNVHAVRGSFPLYSRLLQSIKATIITFSGFKQICCIYIQPGDETLKDVELPSHVFLI